MPDDTDLTRRIEQLEKENSKLRRQLSGSASDAKLVYYSTGFYKGHPIITLEAEGKSFSLGLRKATLVAACSAEIQSFLAQNNRPTHGYQVSRKDMAKPGKDIDNSQI